MHWQWHDGLISHQDVYPGRALEEDGVTLIHPICLPPFGPVDWRMTRSCTTVSFNSFHLYPILVGFVEGAIVFAVSSCYLEKKAKEAMKASSEVELRVVPPHAWK